MSKKPISDARKYRAANARGMGPGAEGRAKIRAAEKLDKMTEKMSEAELFRRDFSRDSTTWGMREKAGRQLAEDYNRSIGGKAGSNKPGAYAKGGKVDKTKPKSSSKPKAKK